VTGKVDVREAAARLPHTQESTDEEFGSEEPLSGEEEEENEEETPDE
jgi:hypothetical protein